MQAAVAAVLSIFSDIGDGFAAACLQTFDWNVDRTVDALLSDNLPPTLRKLDRSLKHVWIGKGGPDGGRAVGSIGASAEKVYALPPESEAFKRAQKERLLAEERKREEDFFLMAAEYQDDYDDQWDDHTGLPSDASAAAQSKGGKGKSDNRSVAQKIQWEVQMDRMKRVNTLLKEKEAEEQYWAEMRNTNHERPTREDPSEGPGVTGGAALGAAKPQQAPRGGRGGGGGGNGGGSGGGGKGGGDKSSGDKGGGDRGGGSKGLGEKASGGGKAPQGPADGPAKKPRTKTYDKHHAKDKTLKGRAFL